MSDQPESTLLSDRGVPARYPRHYYEFQAPFERCSGCPYNLGESLLLNPGFRVRSS